MEIKFWDTGRKEYIESFITKYLVNDGGNVVSLGHSGGGRWTQDNCNNDHIEPHYYKDGERIA